jgi:uncharacterized membrane protein
MRRHVTGKPDSSDAAANQPLADSLTQQIQQNVASIAALLRQEREKTSTPAQRRLEHLSRWVGQPLYLLILLGFVAAWLIFNVAASMPHLHPFDRPPFQWLQGILTLVALLTSTTVLIAQNREGRLEQQRENLDLQINLLTEQKVTRLIALLEELRRDLPMVRDRHDPQAQLLQETTDTAEVMSALKKVGVTAEENRSRARHGSSVRTRPRRPPARAD